MSWRRSASDTLARRLSAVLCLAMLVGLGWGLHRWTAGFEIWTFEGRRQLQLQRGELRAGPVTMLGIDGAAPQLWRDSGSAPAAYLVDFIYTRCTSVCRALGSEYQQMQSELDALPATDPARDAVHLVSISFDVAHDDPASLARYAARLRVDPRLWTLAVPATSGAAHALLQSLGVVVVPDVQGGFVHNGAIHLLDERGQLLGIYEFEQWPQALAAARELAATRREASR